MICTSRHVSGLMRSSPNLVRGLSAQAAPATASRKKNMVLVDGARTPFQMSSTNYKELMPHDLQREAFIGLLRKTGVDPNVVQYICSGTGIFFRLSLKEIITSNSNQLSLTCVISYFVLNLENSHRRSQNIKCCQRGWPWSRFQ